MIFDGAEVKRLRQSRNMTQRQLAMLIGANASAICRITDLYPPSAESLAG